MAQDYPSHWVEIMFSIALQQATASSTRKLFCSSAARREGHLSARPMPPERASAATFRLLSRSRLATMMDLNKSEEHTSELQSLMTISYVVLCRHKHTPTNN